MKRKDKKMGYDRRAVLTCIPSAKRNNEEMDELGDEII